MKKPELLAPAGNMEKLRIAIHYGADAVYLGGKSFSLRNMAGNFTLEELAEAVCYAHDHRVKAYLTLNIYPDNDDLPGIHCYLRELTDIPFDAYIISDPGIVEMVSELSQDRAIHLSTQANTTNWKSALFWQKQGIKRVNLAREMTLAHIRQVRERVSLELEVFIHGAMCISYSGRCLLSSILAGRSANKGECVQPCRWSYSLVEETRPNAYFPVFEGEKDTSIFNSKDLCLLEYLPDLIEAGMDALKIEGRMKGINYVASVVRVYREAIDHYCSDPANYCVQPKWMEELSKISHRGYTTGFLLGAPKDVDYEFDATYVRTHEIVGVVEEVLDNGDILVDVRNRIVAGDNVEFIGRGMDTHQYKLQKLTDKLGIPLQRAQPNETIKIRLPFPVTKYDLIRREAEKKNCESQEMYI